MHTNPSLPAIIRIIAITGMLYAPAVLAQSADYSTDMEEPDIMTVKNDHCCHNEKLKEEANVQLEVKHSILARIKPVNIQVMDASNQEVANFSTRNRIIYMHLPEGRYTVKANGLLEHNTVTIEANDTVLKDLVL